jgi:hypothetical protein
MPIKPDVNLTSPPRHSTPYHVISMTLPCQQYNPAMSDCTDCTVNKILHVWKSGQNMISLTYDVCLNPFKLHWDHEDEAYA